MTLGDHLTNFNRPLMSAAPAVPDFSIDTAERATTGARRATRVRTDVAFGET
jgi:hypothetical protein